MNKFSFANLPFFSGSISEVVSIITRWITTKKKRYVCVTGAHGVMEANQNPKVFDSISSGFVVPDGMPLVWIGKYLGFKNTQRIYGPDVMLALCESAQTHGFKVFLFGTTEQTLQKLKNNLVLRFPKLKIVGVYAPPFGEDSSQEKIIKIINSKKPHIIFVGLSTPKQELWMYEHVDKLSTNVLVGVGAAFDFIARTKKQAPLWMRNVGLEWLYRIFQEPKRLSKRYFAILLYFLRLFNLNLNSLNKVFYLKNRNKLLNITSMIASSFISLILIGFVVETNERIKSKGVINGLRSYFVNEVPYSVLGVGDWVITDPDIGYRLNPDQSGVNEFSMWDKSIVTPKYVNVIRIVILGDSIPFSDKGFVTIAKKKLSESYIEIYNASTPGYTTYQEYKYLEKYINSIKPDIVILSYCLNDNHKFLHFFDQNANMLFTDEAIESLKIESAIDKFVSKSYFLSMLKLKLGDDGVVEHPYSSPFPWDERPDFNTAWKDYSWVEFEHQVVKMKSLLLDIQADLYIIAFPIEDQLQYAKLADDEYVLKPQRGHARISSKHNIPLLDMFSIFKEIYASGVPLYTDGLHLSNEGNIVTADTLVTFLKENIHQKQ